MNGMICTFYFPKVLQAFGMSMGDWFAARDKNTFTNSESSGMWRLCSFRNVCVVLSLGDGQLRNEIIWPGRFDIPIASLVRGEAQEDPTLEVRMG